jgi:DNA (cytosine-5)-methyltransferase 1
MEHKVHNERHIEWISNTPTGKSAFDNKVHYPQTVDKDTGLLRRIKGFKTTYKRMDWDRPAPTVTMMNGSINSQNNCHPGTEKEDGTYTDARVLTIKELLAIVGLPLDWVDHLEHTQKRENFLRKVIGECFPPKMALNIVKAIPSQKTP